MVKFDWDKFNQAEKNLEELFIPKYFPGYTLSVYQNGIESYYSQKGYDDIFNKIEYSRDSIFRNILNDKAHCFNCNNAVNRKQSNLIR